MDADGKAVWTVHAEWADDVVHQLPRVDYASSYLYRTITSALPAALDGVLEVYDVEFEAGKALRYIHKIKDGRHIYFLANLGKTPISTQVYLRGTLRPELWNPHTGEISQPEYRHEKQGAVDVTKVKMSLLPTKSMFVIGEQND
jgi:hypothetical protein